MKKISLDKYLERLKTEAQGHQEKTLKQEEIINSANIEKNQKNLNQRKIILKKS